MTAAAFTAHPGARRPARRSRAVIRTQRDQLAKVRTRAARPRPLRTVSDWADRHRLLTSKGSGEPGQWRTSRTPYLREVMDCLSASSPVQRVVLQFGAQLGKTEAGLNWIGYIIGHAPAPTLVVLPTIEVRKRWVRQRLQPLLTETPAIRNLFNAQRARDAANSEDIKDFPGGFLVLGGANSAASLASMPIRYVLCDEVDRFPWEVGQEGDPLGLIDERTKTFPRRKVLLVSTPTIKGASRIEAEYQASDQRRYHVPCPHCGHYQPLHWRRPDGNHGLVHSETTGRVWYACEDCGGAIDESHKPEMLAAGRWVAAHPERKVRGYALNGLYSPLGLGWSWAELWEQWQAAQGDTASLKRFINTALGETWEEQGESLDDLVLLGRLEHYPDRLPLHVITAGVDVQKDRLEMTLVGWGKGEEAWLLDHLILPGDTAAATVWDDLAEALKDSGVHYAAIDSGYNTQFVQEFCASRRWAWSIKGIGGAGRPLIQDERKRRQRLRDANRRGRPVEPIGVDQGKGLVHSRLRITEPGPGYIHIPNTAAFDAEYFAQLGAEKLVTKARNGRPYQEWVQTRPRNEALDCLVYATAALLLAGGVPKDPMQAINERNDEPIGQPRIRRKRSSWL